MSQARQDLTVAVKDPEKTEWYQDEKVEPLCEKNLTGHSNGVTSLLPLPDGRVLSGSGDHTLRLWNLQTGQCEKTLIEHTGSIIFLFQLPDGRVVSGAGDKKLKLWNLKTGQCDTTLSGHSKYVTSFLPLPDGRIVSGSYDNTLKLWNLKTGQCEMTLTEHSGWVNSLLLLTDGRVVSASSDNTMKLWNLKTGQCEMTFTEHSNWVHSLLLLPDGRVVSGSYDNTLKLWNLQTGQCEKTLTGHSGGVHSLLLLPDGRVLSASNDKTMKLWNLQTGECEKTLTGQGERVTSLLLLPDGRLVSGSYKTLNLWNLKTGQCEMTLTEHSNWIHTLLLLPDGRVMSGSDDKTIKLWDIGLRRRLVQANNPSSSNSTQQITANLNTLSRVPKPLLAPTPSAPLSENEKKVTTTTSPLNITTHLQISYELNYSDLTFGKKLGRGGFGEVYQGTWKQKFNTVAIKKLLNEQPSDEVAAEFKNEAQIMANLRCDFTVQIRGYCLSPHYCLVMEYMPKGSLYNLLHSKETLAWEVRYKIVCDMAYGLAFLHSENILHRDLKSLNILLDEHYKAKLCDFGLSKLKTESQSTNTQASVGTLAWMAPELIKRKATCTKASDVYSLGMTFWEVSSRKTPFEEANGNQALIQNWIAQAEHDDIPEDCPPKLAKLIKWCWEEPAKRPTAEEVIHYLTSDATEQDNNSAALQSGPIYRLNSNS